VHVEDGLSRLRAGVEDQPEVGVAVVGRHGRRLGRHLRQRLGVGRGEVRDGSVVSARHHQDVRGRLRVDVAEGDHPVGLPHQRRRHLTGHDAAEEALGISARIGHPPTLARR
jgi:hypothetical protein